MSVVFVFVLVGVIFNGFFLGLLYMYQWRTNCYKIKGVDNPSYFVVMEDGRRRRRVRRRKNNK